MFSEYVIGCMIDFYSQYYLLTLILKLMLPNYFRPSSMPVYIIKKKTFMATIVILCCTPELETP